MKLSAIILLIVALLASIALSVPTDNYKYCKDILKLNKPLDGDIYMINSTQIVESKINKYCYDKDAKVTYEVFSLGKQKVVDTIVEQGDLYNLPKRETFLIDKVWAKENAKYFIIATIFKGDNTVVSKSGTFTTVNYH